MTVAINGSLDGQKVVGASAEGQYKNAARQLQINYDNPIENIRRSAGLKTDEELLDYINRNIESLNSGFDKSMITQGADVQILSTSVNDPNSTFMISAMLVAMAFEMPTTILIGQQTGRLASDEDSTSWANTCEYQQANVLNPVITELINKLMFLGAIKLREFEIVWKPLTEPKESDRLAIAKQLADINKVAFESFGTNAFTLNEIRVKAGFEPEPKLDIDLTGLPTEGAPGEDKTDNS